VMCTQRIILRSCVSHGIDLWKPLLKLIHVPLQKEIVVADLDDVRCESLAEFFDCVFLTLHSRSKFKKDHSLSSLLFVVTTWYFN